MTPQEVLKRYLIHLRLEHLHDTLIVGGTPWDADGDIYKDVINDPDHIHIEHTPSPVKADTKQVPNTLRELMEQGGRMNAVVTFVNDLFAKDVEFDYRGKFYTLTGDDTPDKAVKAYLLQKLNTQFPCAVRAKKEAK